MPPRTTMDRMMADSKKVKEDDSDTDSDPVPEKEKPAKKETKKDASAMNEKVKNLLDGLDNL